MTQDESDQYIANEIKQGHCPFGMLSGDRKGVLFCCELGLPGCACADELDFNPYLSSMPDSIVESEVS